jgi:hypothetical protein
MLGSKEFPIDLTFSDSLKWDHLILNENNFE